MLFCKLFLSVGAVLAWSRAVCGSPAVIHASSMKEYHNVSKYGVEVNECSSISFKAKTCEDGHILLGDGSDSGSYEFIIGGWKNAKSTIRECKGCSGHLVDTPQLMDCDSQRDLWIAWSADKVSLGTGTLQGAGVLISQDISTIHRVTTMYVAGWIYNITFVFGDLHKSLYKLVGENAKFENGLLEETSASLLHCGRLCHVHPACGMFSHDSFNDSCALFDRTTSQLSQDPQLLWQSWKIKYC